MKAIKFLKEACVFGIDVRIIILLVAIAFISIPLNGYGIGANDHSVEIPLMKHYTNDSLYLNDYILMNGWLAAFTTYFWPMMGILSWGFGMENVFFAVFFLVRLFTYISIYVFSRSLFKEKHVPLLSVLSFLYVQTALGGIYTFSYQLVQRDFAFPLLILSIYFFMEKKYTRSLILNGIAFNLHGVSAFYVFFMYFVYFAISRKEDFIQKSRYVVVFLLASSPTMLWVLSSINFLSSASAVWLEATRMRLSHHIFPLSWHYLTWAIFLYFPVLFFLALRNKSIPAKEKHQKIMVFSFSILLLCVIGTVFVEFIPVSTIIKMHLFRSTKFFILFSVPYIINYSLILLRKDTARKIMAVMIILILVFPAPIKGIVNGLSSGDINQLNSKLARGFVEQDVEWLDVQQWARQNTDIGSVFVTPPYIDGFRVYSERAIITSWKDGAVITHDSNPELTEEWLKRMSALGCNDGGYTTLDDYVKSCRNYDRLIRDDFIELKGMFGADYVVTNSGTDLEMETVYENSKYRVYET